MNDESVCEAIRAALRYHEPRRAIDLEAMAMHVSPDRPNPRRTPTVRSTGHHGSPPPEDPPEVLQHARVIRALLAMDERTRVLTVGACHGVPQRRLVRWLRDADITVSDRLVRSLIDRGHDLVARALEQGT